ncbi:MAG: hypothetical protein ACR2IS_13965 [Nitrososphaeraceae archaeon]
MQKVLSGKLPLPSSVTTRTLLFRNAKDLSNMFIAMKNTIQAIVSGAWLPATAGDLVAEVVFEIA